LQRERQDNCWNCNNLSHPAEPGGQRHATDAHDRQADLMRLEQRAAITQVRALDRRPRGASRPSTELTAPQPSIPTATAQRSEVRAGCLRRADPDRRRPRVLLNWNHFRLAECLAKPVIAGHWRGVGERICSMMIRRVNGCRGVDAGSALSATYPLPHARRGSTVERPDALFSSRFAPAACCTLDNGSMIRLQHDRIVDATGSCVMTRSGRKKELSFMNPLIEALYRAASPRPARSFARPSFRWWNSAGRSCTGYAEEVNPRRGFRPQHRPTAVIARRDLWR
jgi:hypothetical protein